MFSLCSVIFAWVLSVIFSIQLHDRMNKFVLGSEGPTRVNNNTHVVIWLAEVHLEMIAFYHLLSDLNLAFLIFDGSNITQMQKKHK